MSWFSRLAFTFETCRVVVPRLRETRNVWKRHRQKLRKRPSPTMSHFVSVFSTPKTVIMFLCSSLPGVTPPIAAADGDNRLESTSRAGLPQIGGVGGDHGRARQINAHAVIAGNG